MRIGDDVLDVDDVAQTLIANSGVKGEIERLTTRVLRGRVSWTVDGEELRLAKPGGSTLVYRARAAAFGRPDRQSRERVTAREPSTPIADPSPPRRPRLGCRDHVPLEPSRAALYSSHSAIGLRHEMLWPAHVNRAVGANRVDVVHVSRPSPCPQ